MFEWLRHWRFGKQYGYEKFFRVQDRRPVGKSGIILSDLGMPEDYQPDFYNNFMDHVFAYSLPCFIQRFVLADRGIALIDPMTRLPEHSLNCKKKDYFCGVQIDSALISIN